MTQAHHINPEYPNIGDTVLGSFQLLQQLHTGSFAVTYFARQQSTELRVVVKIAHPHLYNSEQRTHIASRFADECEAASRARHKGIATIYKHGFTAQGLPALAMEYIPGRTLGEFFATHAPLKHNHTLNFCFQLAASLHTLHASGLTHNDISPSNIVVRRDKSSKRPNYILINLGIARLSPTQSVTKTNTHLAPELSYNEITPACDIYALGALMVWAITAAPMQPRTSDNTHDLYNALRAHPNTATISNDLLRLICQMLHPVHMMRPSARDILHLIPSLGRSKRSPNTTPLSPTSPPPIQATQPRQQTHSKHTPHPPYVRVHAHSSASLIPPSLTPQVQPSPPNSTSHSLITDALASLPVAQRIHIADLFIGHAPEWIADLEEAVHAHALPNVQRTARHLKAQAQNIRAHRLDQLCTTLEAFAENAMWSEANNLLIDITEEYSSIFRTLLQIMS